MLGKSLTQLSADGWGCVPSLLALWLKASLGVYKLYGRATICLVPQLFLSLCDLVDCSQPGSSVHGDSPGKNAEVGCHALLQVGDLQKGFMSTHASQDCFCQSPVPTALNFQPTPPPPLETLRCSQAGLAQSLVTSLLLSLGTTAHKVLFVSSSKSHISFQSQRKAIPKNAQTTEQLFISHASKEMLKILQARFQQYINQELPMYKLSLEKAEEPDFKLLASTES